MSVKILQYSVLFTFDKRLSKIAMCIETHSGQWNMDRDGNVIAEKPKTKLQEFVHLCDYIASRNYLEFDINFLEKYVNFSLQFKIYKFYMPQNLIIINFECQDCT